MPRKRRSSSSSADSNDEKSSKNRRHKRRNRSSRSSSSDRSTSRKRHSKTSKRNRKQHSSSDSSDRSRSRHSKSSKYNQHKNKHRSSSRSSSSSSSSEKKSRLIDLNMEREKNYEFNDSVYELYKNEQTRRNQINKLDEEGGFKPKSFKSSRSTQPTNSNKNNKSRFTKDQEHDNALFGQVLSTCKDENTAKVNPNVEFNVISSNSKSLMHENLFEDISIKEKRWNMKLLELIKSTN